MNRLLGITLTTLALVAGVVLIPGPGGPSAEAQLDPGNFELYQANVKVGEIFVPNRAPGTRNYLEHWVLFPAYQNPGAGRGGTEIRPVDTRYANLREFYQRVPFAAGSRYVVIGAHESTQLPGR